MLIKNKKLNNYNHDNRDRRFIEYKMAKSTEARFEPFFQIDENIL